MPIASAPPIRVQPVADTADLDQFLDFPWRIYRHDPCWVAPLRSQLARRLDPQHNNFFRYAERELFLARRGDEVVGTIAAIVNHQHNSQLNEQTGYFGFFETIDNQAVAQALIEAAADWLRDQQLDTLRGPVNGAPTDEVGVLLSGFQRRPALWEGHTPPYYARLLADLGFHKYDDVLAYELTYDQLGRDLHRLRPQLWRSVARLRARTAVRLRPLRLDRWDADVAAAHAIYNVAFRTIPGHTDMSLEKFQALARSARPILDPRLALLAEIDGQAVGFAIALPDINEALAHLNGRLTPWHLLKLQWHRRRIRTLCFKLLGVLPEYRGRGLEALLIQEIAQQAVAAGYERCEMSLVSERNQPMNRTIQRMGGRVYRRYRIFERAL